MSSFLNPPTFADVFIIEDVAGGTRVRFNPQWQKWFIDLTQFVSSAGGGSGTIDHEMLSNLLGGAANDHYHLVQERYNQVTQAKNAGYVFAGPPNGGPVAPGFRALVAADVPAGISHYSYEEVIAGVSIEIQAHQQMLVRPSVRIAGDMRVGGSVVCLAI